MEFTGKSVEDAIKQGLEVLGITQDQAEIKIIKEAVKGFFGKVKENAVVDVKEKTEAFLKKELKKENPQAEKKQEKVEKKVENKAKKQVKIDGAEVTAFTEKLLELLNIEAKVEYSEDKENPVVNLISDNSSTLIGFRGEVLDALQVLVGAKANIGRIEPKKVVVDCENYRERRENTLITLAKKLEAKATEIKREVMLEPMSAFERRIIHKALTDSETVKTRSDGQEPNRYVVIVPNEKEEGSTPYNAGRRNDNNNRGRRHNGKNGFGDRPYRPKKNNFGEEKKKSSSISFGTYLGNSLKDGE